MGKSYKIKLLFLILFILITIPSFMMVQFRLSSLATGAIISYILIFFLLYIIFKSKLFFSSKWLFIFILTIILILFHGLLVSTISKVFDYFRFFGSFFIFVFMFSLILILKNFIDTNYFDNLIIHNVLIKLFKLLILFGVLAFFIKLYPTKNYSQLNKGTFPFFEPSHYVLSIAPFLFYFINSDSNKKIKIFYFILFISFLSVVNNLTLLLVIIMSLFFLLRTRKQYFFSLLFIIPIIIFFVILNLDYYSSRIIQNDTENLSALVWIQGWENALIMFKNTYGLGVGFQQFGISGLAGEATDTIAILRASEENSTLNQLDGGTLGAKIIGEFGVIGILIIILLSRISILSIIKIKKDIKIRNNPIYLFSLCILSSYIIEIFARSMSYISHSMFLFLFALIFYIDYSIKKIES